MLGGISMSIKAYLLKLNIFLLLFFSSCSEDNVISPPKDEWIVVKTNLPYNPRFMFFDVSFPTALNGWIVGGYDAYDGGSIINTNDGGKSWNVQVDGTCPGLKSVFFVDHLNGWAAGGEGKILITKDGGVNWTVKTININIGFTAIFFINSQLGWLVGSDEAIYSSSDGGENWTQQRIGDQFALQSVCFIDSLNGWAVGNYYGFSENGIILKTTNSGATWEEQLSTPYEINVWTIKFNGKENGWISCSKGSIYKTNDGGNNWELISTVTQNTITSFEFVDDYNGWAVGYLQTFLFSNNSGNTWELFNPLKDNWHSRVMQSITFSDSRNAWIVGSDGFIVHFIKNN